MEPVAAAILGGLIGLTIGGLAVLGLRLARPSRDADEVLVRQPAPLPPGVGQVLAVLPSSGIVLDRSDRVVNNSPAAVAHGLVRGQELVHEELRDMARLVRRDGEIREAELLLRRGPFGAATIVVGARVAPLGADHVLLLVDDRTEAYRVEQVRRDFVANVSHELKTPVGGIALLSEALLDAHDDPEAVVRFASRIGAEATRLTRLVRDIVDLSRIQGGEPTAEPVVVDLSACAAEAVERCRLLADEAGIELATSLEPGCAVWGDVDLLTTAVANLVSNAVAYSGDGRRVGVTVRRTGRDLVEVSVTDQGVGIPPSEQERIFERFYRVDAARSRATGGTGLGLSIVKHVAENHGGRVSVWSEPGRGSTFTIRLPGTPPQEEPDAGPSRGVARPRPTEPSPGAGTPGPGSSSLTV